MFQPLSPASAESTAAEQLVASEMTPVERALSSRIAEGHNSARQAEGLTSLHEFPALSAYAGKNSQRMVAEEQLGHSEIIDLLDDFPQNMWAAENALVMFNPAPDAVGVWLQSAPHAANLLAPRATHLWVDVRCAADGRMWVTTQFVERPVAEGESLPATDDVVAQSETSDLRCPIETGPFASADEFVSQQYTDFLGRQPDAEGLRYWASMLNTRKVTPSDVVLNFLNSEEFAGRIRPHAEAAMSGSDQFPTVEEVDEWRQSPPLAQQARVADSIRADVDVLMIYVGMLDRTPDTEGFEYWTDLAADGISLDQLVGGFLVSDEYRNRVTP